MLPTVITTERLVLDQPAAHDRDRIVEYCRDPLFETFMTLPWPYEPKHSDCFIEEYVPRGWETDAEYSWALREGSGILGVIGYREATGGLGYWLGASHRACGLMTEEVTAVTNWLFAHGKHRVAWECVVGNSASVSVARKAGFTFTGEGRSALGMRDGSSPLAWHGELLASDDRSIKPGWPS